MFDPFDFEMSIESSVNGRLFLLARQDFPGGEPHFYAEMLPLGYDCDELVLVISTSFQRAYDKQIGVL